MKSEEKRRATLTVSKENIEAGLRKLGLKKGDIVGVHGSLSSFGHVEGGADTVVDALLEVVGEEGTIVMSTHSTNLSEDKRAPEEKAIGVAWKFKILPYNPEETPCSTGIIPETFRKRKGAMRSLHPTSSLAAMGARAKEIVDAGRGGACDGWEKLFELDGHILLLGVGLEVCTAMHLAEKRVKFPKRILDKLTPPKSFVKKYPQDEWEWDFGPYPDFAKLEEPCLKQGIMKTVKVGEALLKLVKLRELINLYVEYLTKNPDLFYS
jgi:aminoglycoside 3-N-acetyltransferase